MDYQGCCDALYKKIDSDSDSGANYDEYLKLLDSIDSGSYRTIHIPMKYIIEKPKYSETHIYEFNWSEDTTFDVEELKNNLWDRNNESLNDIKLILSL